MDYDKLIAPAAQAMRPSGIRKFFDLAAEMPECPYDQGYTRATMA